MQAWTGCVWTAVDTMHTDPTNHSAGQMAAVVHIDKTLPWEYERCLYDLARFTLYNVACPWKVNTHKIRAGSDLWQDVRQILRSATANSAMWVSLRLTPITAFGYHPFQPYPNTLSIRNIEHAVITLQCTPYSMCTLPPRKWEEWDSAVFGSSAKDIQRCYVPDTTVFNSGLIHAPIKCIFIPFAQKKSS